MGRSRAGGTAQSLVLDGPVENVSRPVRRSGQAQPWRCRLLPRAIRCRDAGNAGPLARRAMTPADRINLIADTWALGRGRSRRRRRASFELIDRLAGEDDRAVWDEVLRTSSRASIISNRVAPDARPSRPMPVPTCGRFSPHRLEREGRRTAGRGRCCGRVWSARSAISATSRADGGEAPVCRLPEGPDFALHRSARAGHAPCRPHRRPRDLRHLAGARPQDHEYQRARALLLRCRERARSGAGQGVACALRSPTSCRPASSAHLFFWVAAEHRELAWDFVRDNFDALAAKQGPSFRHTFASSLMTTFADRERAAELERFAPVHETSGGRIVAARAEERILTDADFVAQQLPAIDDWIKRRAIPSIGIASGGVEGRCIAARRRIYARAERRFNARYPMPTVLPSPATPDDDQRRRALDRLHQLGACASTIT